jgi:ubiquinone/menaquinone biosynthesis C-methylase UbiE
MNSRGEASFINLPGLAARLYDSLAQTRAIQHQFQEVARELTIRISRGRLLDIGTGPGRLLAEIHKLNPTIELFGLDIADSMVQVARKNLAGIPTDLRQGNIRHTDYKSDWFDLVTCTGSFYLWDCPEEGLQEIHRILQPGRAAYLFDTRRDFDQDEFRRALQVNLQQENLLRRLITPHFLRRQLRMAYRVDEITEIVRRTPFAPSFTIDKITLAGLPVWLRITLTRSA